MTKRLGTLVEYKTTSKVVRVVVDTEHEQEGSKLSETRFRDLLPIDVYEILKSMSPEGRKAVGVGTFDADLKDNHLTSIMREMERRRPVGTVHLLTVTPTVRTLCQTVVLEGILMTCDPEAVTCPKCREKLEKERKESHG